MMLAQPHDLIGIMMVLLVMLSPLWLLLAMVSGIVLLVWGRKKRRRRAWVAGLGLVLVSVLAMFALLMWTELGGAFARGLSDWLCLF